MTPARGEQGASSLVGLLAAVLILGGVGALVVTATSGGPDHRAGAPLSVGPGTTLSQSPSGFGADIAAAAVVTCRTDYQAVAQAAGYYQAQNGVPAGSLAALAPLIRDPLTSPYFSIRVSAGVVTVRVPGHPDQPGDRNCAYA